jgi:uncharacterized membrane protein
LNSNKWLGLIVGYTVLTLLCVVFIPNGSLLSVVRIVVAYVFVAFIPGYCLISFLFQDGKLDFAERLVLSVALSFSVVGISGLFLGLSPIGINETSIVEITTGIVVVLAVLAYLRKVGVVKVPSRKFGARKQLKRESIPEI